MTFGSLRHPLMCDLRRSIRASLCLNTARIMSRGSRAGFSRQKKQERPHLHGHLSKQAWGKITRRRDEGVKPSLVATLASVARQKQTELK